ncbi:PEP-CTERM sorting domain-containing protein [Pseudoduganella namucuonensis]|uniref:PEP-CTERM protein-sorting domain-containing protein/Myxococcales GC_trans_RRR domain-containing protein/MYXO-CTERM domain-containing protein n=1 Tax=Pseudoduganella namucuonensis TaxID=1035707 RepID=A0A1I7FM83_9BURK|nr:PEP-CTERM sorting domain-containing protein [Pseudoduganella namucuonensis]SFU37284.1 PEP-CTERM protein-sorting domain-containing protein/Myxococcales GC_trans_RRR domain-containing protein/MYXO-CTERM domain-containing protein [Pseudoduganella namucuonensis]
MLKLLATLLLSLAACAAGAAPIVTGGSSYSVFLAGSASGDATFMTNTFDGLTEVFARAGHDVGVNDGETALGLGQHRILLQGSATGDMFPSPGETALIGVGIDGNGLDFSMAVYLRDARIRYYSDGVEVFETGNLADDYRAYFPYAWSGEFAAAGVVFGVGNMGGINADSFELDFLVAELPEPGTPALMALALLAMACASRRRRG